MRKYLFLVPFVLLALAMLAFGYGTHRNGVVVITNTCDTLNDTASGSGLAEFTSGTIYGLNFVDFQNVLCRVILEPSATTTHGYGNADSAIIWLQQDKFNSLVTVDSAICGSLPCTLSVDTTGVNWGTALGIKVYVNDTVSDTNFTADHNVKYEFIIRE